MDSGGRRANQTGRHLEEFVSLILEQHGYKRVKPSAAFFALTYMEQPIYAKQCLVGKDLYDRDRRVDFIVFHPSKWPNNLVIQCKWQASSGTVEQKYPFEVQSIEKNNYPTVIILDGGGYTDGAKNWLYNQAGKGNLKEVMDQGEFQRYANRGNI